MELNSVGHRCVDCLRVGLVSENAVRQMLVEYYYANSYKRSDDGNFVTSRKLILNTC